MDINVEYLGRIGYRHGELMQGFLVNLQIQLHKLTDKKIVLLGVGENSVYAEMLLKNKNLEIFAYADNSRKLWGKSLRGKKYILHMNYLKIMISILSLQQIILQLLDCN